MEVGSVHTRLCDHGVLREIHRNQKFSGKIPKYLIFNDPVAALAQTRQHHAWIYHDQHGEALCFLWRDSHAVKLEHLHLNTKHTSCVGDS